jgi:hypothetical protein
MVNIPGSWALGRRHGRRLPCDSSLYPTTARRAHRFDEGHLLTCRAQESMVLRATPSTPYCRDECLAEGAIPPRAGHRTTGPRGLNNLVSGVWFPPARSASEFEWMTQSMTG